MNETNTVALEVTVTCPKCLAPNHRLEHLLPYPGGVMELRERVLCAFCDWVFS